MIAALFLRYKLALEIAIFGALAVGAVYEMHRFLEHERDIGRQEVQARWDKQAAADKLTAEKQEKDWRDKYDAAINQGAKNAQALQVAAATAAATSGGLRDTITALRDRLPSASAETSRAYASALATISAECQREYFEMAKAAAGHANDAATVSSAWPQPAPERK